MRHVSLPKRNIPELATITISIIVSESQLSWLSVRFFLEGLGGALVKGEVYVDPVSSSDHSSEALARLATLERAVLSKGLVKGRKAIGRDLPLHAEEIVPCDVIVDFRPGPAPAEICRRARFGLWTFSCNDEGSIFRAVTRGASALECKVYRQTGDDCARRSIATMIVQGKHAFASTLTFACEKSVQLALRELKRLAMRRELPVGEAAVEDLEMPGWSDFARYGVRILRLGMGRLIGRIWPAAGKGAPFALRVGKGELPNINPAIGVDLPRHGAAFCADPFLFEKDSQVYCFYEEFSYDTRLGKIAVALLSDGGAKRIGDVLKADHHLSFPFVFEHAGEIFLMPETVQAERIEIWRCTDFPLCWELHSTAFEGERLADSVLFRQGDAWWLFANVCHDSFGDFSSELRLYKVDGPDLNEIVPHPLNPVVVGSDVARGGGRVFESGGHIYRFSQDNSGDIYGYGLNLMEITELSDTSYDERRVAHYTPDCIPGTAGCHHADAVAGRFVVDVRRPRS